MHAMPVMLVVLCLMAIAYRYYSAFLAARVAALDDSRPTPAVVHPDGQNYHPTNKWVLFGHHFAAISGAGPLIGPVLAAQFGYLPGLIWIVVGVCLAGAVQDFLSLAASIRRDGKSLAQIATQDIGPVAGTAASIAILFILIIALAGLGKVVVKTLGGEDVKYPANSRLVLAPGSPSPVRNSEGIYTVPGGTELKWGKDGSMAFPESFRVRSKLDLTFANGTAAWPAGATRVVPGSTWGTFTIACTIPIALFVGLYMYRLRKGRVIEASLIGGALTLGATFLGGWVAHSSIAHYFNLTGTQVMLAMAAYGFIASVLPVWVLLCPRDYLSSFLKIGTIALLVGGTLLANPVLEAPAFNHVFSGGGPVVSSGSSSLPARVFPFLFICIMCGAISGFHSLVSSGTTPKMIARESDARTIGYGAMLIEALVGVVAMIAAATLPVGDYYAMNVDLAQMPAYHERILSIPGGGVEHIGQYEDLTQESLRGRTGGAVTLAVGMAHIFDDAVGRFWTRGETALRSMWKYWYHFAIMFEALFILTTIDTGTRIGRFVLQEVVGKWVHPKLGQSGWWPSAVLSTLLIVVAWAYLLNANSMAAIWPMFGVANQMLAVIALAVVSVYLANEGRARYLWVSAGPMLVVATTTTTAAAEMLSGLFDGLVTQYHNAPTARDGALIFKSSVEAGLILAVLACGAVIVICGAIRVWRAISADRPVNFRPVRVAPGRA